MTIPKLIYQYRGPRNNPGYIFSSEEDDAKQKSESMLFIYSDDFECILPIVKAQYPLIDPRTGEQYDAFDPCWDNPISAATWTNILEELDHCIPENADQRTFVDQFTAWIRSKLAHTDTIIIEGTL
ncbi:hypothetical protein [Paenibacillus wenxiniae]|uniref:Uncharacterized protein n=1 Tax=Paenibacillus wenxiniae TaxID=1636843 RepID=A0ABW4RDA0_9BACL